ncbi:ABC transporter permease [Occultella aeris]|uniref:ABC-2 family transporter protein n=1 Tax=Occultella aeris TaxID=2761496 RepID=A0A7M4DS43_9MICO|nr:ABC transporter permease [Occultella aeris]VZO40287.1 ABC-2 family transporter protein [Occultella aeris]
MTTTDSSPQTPTPSLDEQSPPAPVRNPWLIVTIREIMVKLADKSFVISTIVTLAMIAASVVIGAVVGNRTSDYTVGTSQAEAAVVAQAGTESITSSGDTLEITQFDSEDALRTAVLEGDVDAGLVAGGDGWVLLGGSEVDSALSAALTDAVSQSVLAANAEAAGTTLGDLMAGSEVTTELLDPDADRGALAVIVGFIFAFLFYMAAIIFGMTIANSVLEEKQNRVVEILATAIPIRQLLYGKVLGNSLLAFAQILLYCVVGLTAVNLTGLAGDIGWILSASGWFIAFFVVGFTALAAVWAVLGSLASRSEDLQSNTGPIITVIMVALFVGLFAEGIWLDIASFVPVVSSVAMPIRMLADDVPVWQGLVSLALTAVAAYGLLRLGERIYQRAVMQGGTALSWRQALKLQA